MRDVHWSIFLMTISKVQTPNKMRSAPPTISSMGLILALSVVPLDQAGGPPFTADLIKTGFALIRRFAGPLALDKLGYWLYCVAVSAKTVGIRVAAGFEHARSNVQEHVIRAVLTDHQMRFGASRTIDMMHIGVVWQGTTESQLRSVPVQALKLSVANMHGRVMSRCKQPSLVSSLEPKRLTQYVAIFRSVLLRYSNMFAAATGAQWSGNCL